MDLLNCSWQKKKVRILHVSAFFFLPSDEEMVPTECSEEREAQWKIRREIQGTRPTAWEVYTYNMLQEKMLQK